MFTRVLRLSALVGGLLLAAASGSSKPQQQQPQQPYYPQQQPQPYYPQQQPQPYNPQQQPQYGNTGGDGGGAGFGGGNYGGDSGGGGGQWKQDGEIVSMDIDLGKSDPMAKDFCDLAVSKGCQAIKSETYTCIAQCPEAKIGFMQSGNIVTVGCSGVTSDQCATLFSLLLED